MMSTPLLRFSSPDHDNGRCSSSGYDHELSTPSILRSPFARSKSCDVYIGFSIQTPSLLRFVNWLHAELQLQGVSCSVSNRKKCQDATSHVRVKTAIDAATVGVVIITKEAFTNPYSMEELRLFLDRKILLPIFFDFSPDGSLASEGVAKCPWKTYGGLEEEWKEVVKRLSQLDYGLQINAGNWRDCISETVEFIGLKLGRRSIVERVNKWKQWSQNEEHIFPRNTSFVGRSEELHELEHRLFGYDHCKSVDCKRAKNYLTTTSSNSRNMKYNEKEKKGKQPLLLSEEEEIHKKSSKRYYSVEQYGKGIAIVSGDSGIGKTEILLEFSYRFSQMYKKLLWISGKARYIWQSYMNILPSLEVDVSLGYNDVDYQGKGIHPRNFEELENQAISRVRKELTRGIPYLIVIDDLEMEDDWWNRWNIKQLLPHSGRDTHILISTRLPTLMEDDISHLRLQRFSSSEAISLMTRNLVKEDLPPDEVNALQTIQKRLGRLTFGLLMVNSILTVLEMSPKKLLYFIDKIPLRELTTETGEEDHVLRQNPFLVRLLDFCLLAFDLADKPTKLTSRMIESSGWFAPSPVPMCLLAMAASDRNWFKQDHNHNHHHKSWKLKISWFRQPKLNSRKSIANAISMLVTFHIARRCIRGGTVYFHDIIRVYARERGNKSIAAHAVFHTLNLKACLPLPHHRDHIWEACFLLFDLHHEPVISQLTSIELMSFIKRLVLPLAWKTFTESCHCNAAIELLYKSSQELEILDDSFLSRAQKELTRKPKCPWWVLHGKSTFDFDPYTYREFALLRTTILETRAKIMHTGGFHDIGEQLHRTALSIKEVILPSKHQVFLP